MYLNSEKKTIFDIWYPQLKIYCQDKSKTIDKKTTYVSLWYDSLNQRHQHVLFIFDADMEANFYH